MERTKYSHKSMAILEIAQPISYLVNSRIRVLRNRRRLQQDTSAMDEFQEQSMSEQEQFLSVFGLRRVLPNIPPLFPEDPEHQRNTPAKVSKTMSENNKPQIFKKEPTLDLEKDKGFITKGEPTFAMEEDNRVNTKNESMLNLKDNKTPFMQNVPMFNIEENNASTAKKEPIEAAIDVKEDNTPITKKKSIEAAIDMEEDIALTSKKESIEAAIDMKEDIAPTTKKELIEAAIDVIEDNSPLVKKVKKNTVGDKTIVLRIGGKNTFLEYHPAMARFYHSKVKSPLEQAKRDRNNEACRKSRARAKARETRKYTWTRLWVKNEE